MLITVCWTIGAIVVVALAGPFRGRFGGGRAAAMRRFAGLIGLPLEPGVEAAAMGRARLLQSATTVGGCIGLAVGIAAAVALPALTGEAAAGVLVFPIAVAGIAIGSTVGSIRAAFASAPRGAGVARLVQPTHRDFVAPAERNLTLGAVVAGLLLPVAGMWAMDAVGAPHGPFLPTAAALGVAGVALLGAAALVSRRITALPQRAGSPLELAWDDAIRAQGLRDVLGVPAMAASGGAGLTAVGLTMSGVEPLEVAGFWLLIAMLGVVALLVRQSTRIQPQRYYRARLWPAFDTDAEPGPGPTPATEGGL